MTPDLTEHPPRLFVVSAPSGCGKTTLCRALLERVADLSFSVSHTTRAPRTGEVSGRNYHFIDRQEFERRVAAGRMAEWAEIYGNLYGTAVDTIRQHAAAGQDILFDIDERGARQLQAVFPGVVTILVLPPSIEVLRQRLVDRQTDTEAAVKGRLAQADAEMRAMAWYGYVIVNDRFETALDQLACIVAAERCRGVQPTLARLLDGNP